MFESNFAVDKGACSYPALFNAFKRLTGRRVGIGKDRSLRRHRVAVLPAGEINELLEASDPIRSLQVILMLGA